MLLIMTSNAAKEFYTPLGYGKMLRGYRKTLDTFVGKTKTLIAGDTLQVKDYGRYDRTMFNAEAKRERHDKVFPEEKKKAFGLGGDMVRKPW